VLYLVSGPPTAALPAAQETGGDGESEGEEGEGEGKEVCRLDSGDSDVMFWLDAVNQRAAAAPTHAAHASGENEQRLGCREVCVHSSWPRP